jgi:ABC-type amino acid transport substrate-binding protein
MFRSIRQAMILAAALAVPLAQGAEAPAPARPSPESVPLAKRTSLKVIVYIEKERPEFFSMDPKQNPGFEREILDSFAKAQKLPLEVVEVPRWEALIPSLLEDKGDVIAGHFTNTDERRAQVDFTQPLLPTRTVIVTRKPRPVVTTVKQLQAIDKIGSVKGSATMEDLIAAGVPHASIDDTITPNNMLEALKAGKVGALARSIPLAVLSQRDDPAIQLGIFLGSGSHFAFGVRKGDTVLREALNDYIELMRGSGQWNRLIAKYFGPSAIDILKKAQTQ